MKLLALEVSDFEFIKPCIETKKLQYEYSANIFEYPFNIDNFAKYILEYKEEFQKDKPSKLTYKMVDVNGDFIGHIAFYQINYALKTATLGPVFINCKYRKKGFNQEMLKLMLDVGFNKLGFHRIELKVFDFNKSAIDSYERFGFKREGLLREVIEVDSKFWSVIIMSMLENEFKDKYENKNV